MRRISPVGHYMRGLCFTKNEGERDKDSETGEKDGMKRRCSMRICARTHVHGYRETASPWAQGAHEKEERVEREGDPRWREREEPAAKG